MLTLYDYFRSTASYRVRIALNYKNLEYRTQEVHLVKDGGQQHLPEYQKLNPQSLVPTLVDGEVTLTQSLAILEYLEEQYPTPALLPTATVARAKVRRLAQTVATDIHPLNNLRVLKYLTDTLGVDETQKLTWYHHWLEKGFSALENLLANDPETGNCCHSDHVTFADVCLIPQIYNANRFEFPMQDYPTLLRINEYCLSLPAFIEAQP